MFKRITKWWNGLDNFSRLIIIWASFVAVWAIGVIWAAHG